MLELTLYATPEEFLAENGETLYREEALNSLMLGIVERLVIAMDYYGETPFLSAVHDDGELVLAATMTPPFGLVLGPVVEDVRAAMPLVLEVLVQQGWSLPDVNGRKPYVQQFAEQWAARTGGTTRLDMAQRLYALHTVTPPVGVPGDLAVAQTEHIDLVTEWMRNFEIDCFGHSRPVEKIREAVQRAIGDGNWHLWLVDGEPVSMCIRTRPIRNTASVSGVYTPDNHRRKGYAGACVAGLSQKLLDEGFAYITLFTDLANPTSNSVYMRLGYEALADFDKYVLKK